MGNSTPNSEKVDLKKTISETKENFELIKYQLNKLLLKQEDLYIYMT
jgi:hypothetical protein